MSGITTENNFRKNVWAVFTNKRKAQIYCEYKREITDNEWKKRFYMKSVSWTVEEERIWTEDFTRKLNQIQAEKLPF